MLYEMHGALIIGEAPSGGQDTTSPESTLIRRSMVLRNMKDSQTSVGGQPERGGASEQVWASAAHTRR